MKTNTGITVYNKYIDAATRAERYQRTQIPAAMWENRKAAVLRSGNLAADKAAIYIPFSLGENYLKPLAWKKLSTKTGKWTLQEGDVIVKGLVTDEITVASVGPPAVVAFTISDLAEKYDDVLTIWSVDTMDMGSSAMQHWQVGAA